MTHMTHVIEGRRAGPGRGRGRGGRGGGGRGGGLNPLQPRHTAGIGYDTSKDQSRPNAAANNEGPGIVASLNQTIIRDIMTKLPLPTEDDYNPDEPTEGKCSVYMRRICWHFLI